MAVGIGAELDLAASLLYLPVLDSGAVRDACRATLAKSPSDLAVLDDAFDAYWFGGGHSEARGQVRESVVPQSPPPDARPAGILTGPPSLSFDERVVLRIGVYSPDAPPAGHPFVPLDDRRRGAFRAGARRLRREVATLPGRRFEPARRGRIDFARTLRSSLRHGGEYLELRHKRRRALRTELAILWDVSGSMREHDNELFAIVHSLLHVSRRSRVFAFSTDLEELTDRTRGLSYRHGTEALPAILRGIGGGTQLGRCLQDFRRRHGALIHPRTTIVVLSDGWDLGDVAAVQNVLAWLRGRAHAVLWVNPYARRPGFRPETAAMAAAMPYISLLLAPEDFESRRASLAPARYRATA